MYCVVLWLLLAQTPAEPESVLWSFKAGQEFFVEETQRQLLQVNSPTVVTSYLDYAYLWRYFIVSQNNNQVKVQATLEKVRVNNPNELGARAGEALKKHAGSKSTWLLTKNDTGWVAEPMPGEPHPHAVPYFLTLGTTHLTDQQDNWTQLWKVPIADWGNANLHMSIAIKQRINDRLVTTVRTKMDWPADNTAVTKVSYQPNSSAISGLGEFDFTKGRWSYFEFRVDGAWQVTRQEKVITMKQNNYCSYRLSERQPTFP